MARRIEITVPTDYTNLALECLEDPKRGNYGPNSDKQGIFVQIPGLKHTIFQLTIPGGQVGPMLEYLKECGIGNAIGHVTISPIDCLKPRFKKPSKVKKVENGDIEDGDGKKANTKQGANLGFKDFQKARMTTEEIYNNILNSASMTINTWFNLIGACLIAGGGLTTNATVFIVAAMLISPIMGPILGMTFGYRIADWKLFKLGFINWIKMTIVALICGIFIGLILGAAGNTYGWPTDVMIVKKNQLFSLIVSIVVSGAAGMVLGVSVTSGGVNTLVGTAISAGLLPPLVNAGIFRYLLFVV